MNVREIVPWCLAGLLALAAAGGWAFYYGECQARAGDHEQWRSTIQRLESHTFRGMMLEAQKAKEKAQAADKKTIH
jgi:hypothetical protein